MKYSAVSPKITAMLHGADYNPDQWLDYPGILDEDIRLMKLANCNVMALGMFSWSMLEPQEGKYNFDWLDTVMERLAASNIHVILSTPSGAKPAWLSRQYPEVRMTNEKRQHTLHGGRHNHCSSSRVYREKTQQINRLLAERYGNHPSLIMWHISNEYGNNKHGGECHCETCQQGFRNWLMNKYNNDLSELNRAWWTSFWSHRYSSWEEVESPSSIGERSVHCQNLDWRRFVTWLNRDFFRNEILPIRELSPEIPITTNFMGTFYELDYFKFAEDVDVVSWDSYPEWHTDQDSLQVAVSTAFAHDLNRSLKGGRPFMLMESTPSNTNWQPVPKLKRPGMHLLSSLQAVAHGSDTVQYFQWRKSRGSYEKFHGAVVDHCGHEHTRVFQDVSETGRALQQLQDVVGSTVDAKVAVIFDWENRWAFDDAKGLHNLEKQYLETVVHHYRAFWEQSVPVDVIDMDCDLSGYQLIVAPVLYMVKPGFAEKIEGFVEAGGCFVTTYCSGLVDEHDLCFLGGFPGPLRKLLGIWVEETDSLTSDDYNSVRFLDVGTDQKSSYTVKDICDLLHCETATPLAVYEHDFYAGHPALTCNSFGSGQAYYIAFRNNEHFEKTFYSDLLNKLRLSSGLNTEIPENVHVQQRENDENRFWFIMNFGAETVEMELPGMSGAYDVMNECQVYDKIGIAPCSLKVIKTAL